MRAYLKHLDVISSPGTEGHHPAPLGLRRRPLPLHSKVGNDLLFLLFSALNNYIQPSRENSQQQISGIS